MPISMEEFALWLGELRGTTKALQNSTERYLKVAEEDRQLISDRLKKGDIQFDRLTLLVRVGIYWLIGLTTLTFASWGFPEIFTKISLLFAGVAH